MNQNILKLTYPASWWAARWREALPAGNGAVGAAVYGSVDQERVMLTHEDMWCNRAQQEMPDVSAKLPDLRRLLLAGKIAEAETVLSDALREQGYRQTCAYPVPLGDLEISQPGISGFKGYGRTLNMESGEIVVCWQDGEIHYERALFVSCSDDVIVCEIRCSAPGSINATLTLDLHDRTDALKPYGSPTARLPEGAETQTEGHFIRYAARNDDGLDFGAVARVQIKGGHMACAGDKITIAQADRVLLLIKVFPRMERRSAWNKLQNELSGVTETYSELFQSHLAVHNALFRRTSLDLKSEQAARSASNEELLLQAYRGQVPTALVEKLWAFGRYLLISSSREGENPCPLQGLWGGEYEGFWSFNMANENLEMIYWQALSGNMPELLLPVFDYYDRMMGDFRTNARHLYSCRGIFVPAISTPDSGRLEDLQPHIIHWTGAAGWLAQHYYDYYRYTQDERFLRERALPFLRETAHFYEDFLIIGDDGLYLSMPSVSPENVPANWLGETRQDRIHTTINATMDFAIAKEVLTNLIEGAELAGTYPDEVKTWQTMLTRIPPYQINQDGAIREWMHPWFEDNYHHRHQSHLYPVFPGMEITKEEQPELFEAFVTAVKKRLVIGLRQQTSWSLTHMACIYARMGEGDLALECLDILGRSALMNNFFTVHNDWRHMGLSLDRLNWAPFQIDANMGWTAAVQEMLLFSKPGWVSVLPALPARWTAGTVHGLLCRGGIELDLDWDLDRNWIEVTLRARHAQTVRLTVPKAIRRVDIDGATYGNWKDQVVEGLRLEKDGLTRITLSLED